MDARRKFVTAWKTNYNVLTVPLYAIVLIVMEEVMEAEFKCPRTAFLKKFYVFAYFFCPAFITFFLSLICHPECIPYARCVRPCSFSRLCQIMATAFLPPVIWCVILLYDGRYAECLASADTNNTAQNDNQRGVARSPSESHMMSQIAALYILTALVFVCGVCYLWPCWFCCNYEEGHQKEQLHSLLEEKVVEHIQKKKEEIVELVMKEEENDSLWDISNKPWKITAKKVKEFVEFAVTELWDKKQDGDEPGTGPQLSPRSSGPPTYPAVSASC